jgi:murein DD-endopeptidase MepM/ murein hydrolase activator NlpD
VDRRNDPMFLLEPDTSEPEWQVPMHETSLVSAIDGRWAFVTGSLMTLIVGSVAWLAMMTTPPSNSRGFEAVQLQHDYLPYRLFQQMTQSSGAFFASLGGTSNAHLAVQPTGMPPLPNRADANPGIDTRTVTLDSGDTLAGALQEAGVSATDANTVVAALGKVYNPRSLRAGQSFELTLTTPKSAAADDGAPAQLTNLKFSPSIEHDVTVTRAADGSFVANDAVKQLAAQTHRAAITIDSSLYLSAMQAGIPADVVVEMIRMFSYKVDFQRDIQPGDSFEVFYDYYYTPQGQPARIGNITYARMRLGGKDISLYRFQPDANSPADYFDSKGQSTKGMLMKTPVDGARITSGFGMRFHPVLGFTRMHKGIDFGVPIGTPVMAAGAGVVKYAGWMNGYGNFVVVDHGNGYSTGYGHLSRINVSRGAHVRQAQIIARSGMTGIATGPHLHYEIRINNNQVNPLKVKIASGRKLGGRDLAKFLGERQHIDAQLAGTKLETKVADISANSKPSAK